MKLKISDITEKMKEAAVANAPEGATDYHFNSGQYYACIFGLTFQYVNSIKGFALLMTEELNYDVKLSVKTEGQPLIIMNNELCRTLKDEGELGWFNLGKIYTSAIEDHNKQVRGNL